MLLHQVGVLVLEVTQQHLLYFSGFKLELLVMWFLHYSWTFVVPLVCLLVCYCLPKMRLCSHRSYWGGSLQPLTSNSRYLYLLNTYSPQPLTSNSRYLYLLNTYSLQPLTSNSRYLYLLNTYSLQPLTSNSRYLYLLNTYSLQPLTSNSRYLYLLNTYSLQPLTSNSRYLYLLNTYSLQPLTSNSSNVSNLVFNSARLRKECTRHSLFNSVLHVVK